MSTVEHSTLDGVGLLLVDVQYDFIDGSLAIPEAAEILPAVKELIESVPFSLIVASQDYHPAGHVSFASRHPDGLDAFTVHQLPHPVAARADRGETMKQMLWPDHCVQGTRGATLHEEMWSAVWTKQRQGTPVHVIQKGTEMNVDGYSAFADNQYLSFTELPRILFSHTDSKGGKRPVDTLVVVGLAADYCVMSSAIDARKFHLRTIVVHDGVRGVAAETTASAMREMQQWGVEYVQSVTDLRTLLHNRR